MSEKWRKIPSFPDYKVSTRGRVKRITACMGATPGHILKPYTMPNGYEQLSLRKNKETYKVYVHRLVLKTFRGQPPSLEHECNHKDGNKQNNQLTNLEWVTRSKNRQHAWDTGLRKWTTK